MSPDRRFPAMLSLLNVSQMRDQRTIVHRTSVADTPEGAYLPRGTPCSGDAAQNSSFCHSGSVRHGDSFDLVSHVFRISDDDLHFREEPDILDHRRSAHQDDVCGTRWHFRQCQQQTLLASTTDVVKALVFEYDPTVCGVTCPHLSKPDSGLVEDSIMYKSDAMRTPIINDLLKSPARKTECGDVQETTISLLPIEIFWIWAPETHFGCYP
mmetsp:Transcript_83413/g.174544  ORF Transcript_83413/g.174544 Transcript_83413/m.174544 type:complete len:211 (+) Transcript_83413:300-932(+)